MGVRRATEALFRKQQPGGYWWAELQSNVSITAEVLLLHHVWDNFERVPRAQAEAYFRGEQRAHGGWELAYDDGGELSVSTEAYLALRARPDELFIDAVKRLGVEPFKERVYAAV